MSQSDFRPYQDPATGGGLAWSQPEVSGEPDYTGHPPFYQQQAPQDTAWQPPQPPEIGRPYYASSSPPPRGQRRRLRWLAAGAAAAALAAAGLIYALASGSSSGSGGGHTATGLKVLWAASGAKGTASGTGLAGSWASASTVVDGRSDGLIAYSLRNGAQVWGYQIPGGALGCGMSTSPVDEIGVLAYGADRGTCDQLIGLDVDTGKQAWGPISLKDTSRFPLPIRNPHLATAGTTLAVQGPQNTIIAYDLASGARKWATAPDTNIADDTCSVTDVQAVKATVYALYQCEGLSSAYTKLVGYDAGSGAQSWKGDLTGIPASDAFALSLWSADQAGALLLVDSTPKHEGLYVYPSGATAPVHLDLTAYNYNAFSSTGQSQDQRRAHGYAIFGSTLYLENASPIHGISNAITALDLTSGRKLWTQDLGGGIASTIITADERGLHTVLEIPGQSLYQLATYDAATGKVSKGPGTSDGRFTFTADSTLYLSGDYLVNLPASVLPNSPELIVLGGASH